MSMGAALKAAAAVALLRRVLAVEILAAAQALDLLAPLTTALPLQRVQRAVREVVPTLAADRSPAPDIDHVDTLIARGAIDGAAGIDIR
jgi:histidine ammonia-lyase